MTDSLSVGVGSIPASRLMINQIKIWVWNHKILSSIAAYILGEIIANILLSIH